MALSEKAEELLELYPPVFRGSRHVQGILDSHALEIERIETATEEITGGPTNSVALLTAWEQLVGLTAAEGASLQTRRQRLLGYFKRLETANAGLVWEAKVNELISGPWTYATHHPDNVLGLWWERSFDSSKWTGDTSLVNAGFLEGAGAVYRDEVVIPDSDQTTKFQFRKNSGFVSVIGKFTEDGDRIQAKVTPTKLSIETVRNSTNTERDPQTISLSTDTTYYLRFENIQDDLVARIYDVDPLSPAAAPLATANYTLTGDDRTFLGEGVSGEVGFGWDGSHLLLSSKGSVANISVPERTIRIFLPYEGVDEATRTAVQQAQVGIRGVTPATIDLEYVFGTSFLLGISRLGEQGF